jgi:predicted NAD-dependent protein-ADP-ribosyltransferase YbiA (DUF1768 family)
MSEYVCRDGVDYINVYSQGATTLGRLLSNFAHTKISVDGEIFESVESWWYWMKMVNINKSVLVPLFSDEHLSEIKTKVGRIAKDYFRKLYKDNSFEFNPSKEELKKVYILKIEQHPHIKEMLLKNDLPFEHYYVMGDKKVEAKEFLWTATLWEEIKKEHETT